MKISNILFTLLITFNLSMSFAQDIKPNFQKNDAQQEEEKNKIRNSLKEIVIYNASLIGYSKFCKSGDEKSRAILAHFNNLMGTVNLNDTDSKYLENEFLNTMRISASGKNLPTNFTCSTFNTNFNLIYEKLKEAHN